MTKKIAIGLVVSFVLLLVPAPNSAKAFNSATAESYLRGDTQSPWSTMAFSVLGAPSIPTDHLKSISGSSAIEYAAPILAITAISEDPRTFGSSNYVEDLKSYYSDNQIGDIILLNDDIFGILALVSAGQAQSDSVIAGAKNFILANQNSDGGWGFSTSAPSDTNMTASAILALIASGADSNDSVINNALDYLDSAQNSDGGFPYDPESSFGTDSDSASTAWVVWAYNALGVNDADAVRFLEAHQTAQGFFEYQSGLGENSFTPIITAYAVIALSGKTLPVNDLFFDFRIESGDGQICSGKAAGPSALDIVKDASIQCGFDYEIQDTSFGLYLSRIGEYEAQGVTGWLYFINLEAPSIGANEYILKSGDSVLWHYGDFDWWPSSAPVNMEVIIDAGNVEGIQNPSQDIIAFVVTPDNIDFGTLKPGQNSEADISIQNNGLAIQIETIVGGDKVFSDYLTISGQDWSIFQTELANGEVENYSLYLNIPAGFSGVSGKKQGKLTFWATGKD